MKGILQDMPNKKKDSGAQAKLKQVSNNNNVKTKKLKVYARNPNKNKLLNFFYKKHGSSTSGMSFRNNYFNAKETMMYIPFNLNSSNNTNTVMSNGNTYRRMNKMKPGEVGIVYTTFNKNKKVSNVNLKHINEMFLHLYEPREHYLIEYSK